MAAYSSTDDAVRAGDGGMLARLAGSIRDHFIRRQVYRRSLDELGRCSDRELNDMGIARSDIRRLAIEAARAAC